MKASSGVLMALLVFACVSAAQAQDATASLSSSALYPPAAFSFASDSPVPTPRPRRDDIKGHRGDWQIGAGLEEVFFRSRAFNAHLTGLHTSVTYFRRDWLGIEGNVVAAFGTSTLNNEAARSLLYTAGPRIAWRRYTWQPWTHALVGGLHAFPQTGLGQNGFAAQLGGGVDWRFKPLISLRFESDYVRSQLFSSGQNNFQFGMGIVAHF